MSYCKECGRENLQNASFCQNCGIKNKKSRLSKLFSIIIYAVLILIIIWPLFPKNVCDLPLKYSVGQVDSRFNIADANVKVSIIDAGNRWNQAFNKTIFQYDETSSTKINLVYDERQATLDKLKSDIKTLESTSSDLLSQNGQLEKLIVSYEADLNKYNKDVSYYNAYGGTLEQETSLNLRRNNLEKRRKSINQTQNLLNSKVDSTNNFVDDVNQVINDKKDKQEIEGEYFGADKHIDIFMFNDQNNLRLVLMHEIGHAFGADHATSPRSIMYYLLQEQNMIDPQPLEADMELVNNVCHIN